MTQFLRAQRDRLTLRGYIFLYSVRAVVFWTAVLIGLTWMQAAGVVWIGLAAVAAWLVLGLPGILVQLLLLLDLVAVGMTGGLFAYPAMLSRVAHDPGASRRTRFERLCAYAADTFPLVGLATWALVVVSRSVPGQQALRSAVASAEERAKEIARMRQRHIVRRQLEREALERELKEAREAARWLERAYAEGAATRRAANESKPRNPRPREVRQAIEMGRRIEDAVLGGFTDYRFKSHDRELTPA